MYKRAPMRGLLLDGRPGMKSDGDESTGTFGKKGKRATNGNKGELRDESRGRGQSSKRGMSGKVEYK